MADQDQSSTSGGEKRGGSGGASGQSGGLQEDKLLQRLPTPESGAPQVPQGMTCLVGILGRSPRDGYWVLYLGLDMTRQVEIREEDVLFSEQLPADQSPFGSLGGTRVCVKRGATLDYSRTTRRKVQAESLGGGEFDLDIRLGKAGGLPQRGAMALPDTDFNNTCGADCGGGTGIDETCFTCNSCGDTCFRTCNDTCRTQCDTCPGDTCRTCNDTCRTQCGTCATCRTCNQQTCATCNQQTCATCNQQTCQTCNQQTCATCNQQTCQTCQTCRTACGTCQTCRTCNDTCRTQCDTCPGDTCRACTHVQCF